MKYLIEIDHPKSGAASTREEGRRFINEFILPTLDELERLDGENRIVAGGPVAGRIALRFIIEVASPAELDQLLTRIRLWPIAESRITPLIDWADRRRHVEAILATLSAA